MLKIDDERVVSSNILCKYCKEKITSGSTSGALIQLIYHIQDKHKK